ncbi:hypothetical protein IFM89_029385 [Coptis chinensis]|uniref:Uncharacterized protein n=1 Tax=Coptis chinensis TaxID=261450 RepID=A0A835IQX3_9MAGN|nr:hypothetical protein IFM89_029385 [Coptis chinensis]
MLSQSLQHTLSLSQTICRPRKRVFWGFEARISSKIRFLTMGASGKWLKSAVGMKKPEHYDQEKVNGSHHRAASETSQCSSTDDAFNAAVATGVRAPPKSFRVEARMSCYSYGFLMTGAIRQELTKLKKAECIRLWAFSYFRLYKLCLKSSHIDVRLYGALMSVAEVLDLMETAGSSVTDCYDGAS